MIGGALPAEATPAERSLSEHAAILLWLVSAGVFLTLAAWSTGSI